MRAVSRRFFVLLLCLTLMGWSLQQDISTVKLDTFFSFTRINVQGHHDVKIKVTDTAFKQVKSGSTDIYLLFESADSSLGFRVTGMDASGFSGGKVPETRAISGITKNEAVLVVISQNSTIWKDLQSSRNIYVRFTTGSKSSNETKSLTISTMYGETADLLLGRKYFVYMEGNDRLRFQTNVVKSNDNHHYKFLAESKEAHGDVTLSGYGLKGNKDATPQNKEFDLARYGRDKIGYVIDQASKLYCNAGTCTYSITLETKNIKLLDLYLGEHTDNEPLFEGYHTIGYIKSESIKHNLYVFPVNDTANTLVFTLIPIEGSADLLVNPGFSPASDDQFYYKASGSVGKRVIVDQKDLENMKLKNGSIFIKVTCPNACRYILETQVAPDGVIELRPGYSESGDISVGDARQHLLVTRHYNGQKLQRDFTIKLQLYSGEGHLYVKQCPETGSCVFTPADMKDLDHSSVLFNNDTKPYKEIHVPMLCSRAANEQVPPGTILSRSCALNVIVQAVGPAKTKIKYHLAAEDNADTHVFSLNHFTFIKLWEGKTKTYTLSYNHPPAGTQSMAIVLDGKYGTFRVCVKLNGESTCRQSQTIDANTRGLSGSYKRMIFDIGKAGENLGEYRIELDGVSASSGLILGAIEISDSSRGMMVSKELKAGLAVTDHLPYHNHTAFYHFHVPLIVSGYAVDSIRVHLSPIKGDFILCVSNDGTKPTPENNGWQTFTNELTITQDDPLFKSNSDYIVAVYPLRLSDQEQEYQYQLKWTYTDKHSVLAAGLLEQGTMMHNKMCYVAELLQSYNTVMFLKGGHRDTDVFISVGNRHHRPDVKNHDFSIRANQGGVEMKKEDIARLCQTYFENKHHCNVHLCIHGPNHRSFVIGFSANEQPFTLPHGKIIQGPIPTGNRKINFIYHPRRDESVDFEELTSQGSVSIAAGMMEEHESYIWPTNSVTTAGPVGFYHLTREQVNSFKKPVVLISMSRSQNIQPQAEDFDFNHYFSLEAGMQLKELPHNHPRIFRMVAGAWNYYYFYNEDPKQTVYIGLDSLNGGDADMYLGKGKDARPNVNSFLTRSYGFQSTHIIMDSQLVTSKGYHDMKDYYVVAVKANQDIEFSLEWKHSSNLVQTALFNQQRSIKIRPGGLGQISLFNYFNETLEITVHTRHQPIKIYWTTMDSRQHQNMGDEQEYFPTPNSNKLVLNVPADSSIYNLVIPKETPGFCVYCRHLFAIHNLNEHEIAEVEYKINAKTTNYAFPESINPSVITFGAATAGELRKYLFSVPISPTSPPLSSYYLEVHMIHGHADTTLRPVWFNAKPEENIARSCPVGYTKISFAEYASRITSTPTQFHFGLLSNMLNIEVRCSEQCTYKLIIVHPERFSELQVNHPREAFNDDASKNETFYYHVTGKEKRFDVIFSIVSFTDPNKHDLTNDELRKLINVYHVPNKTMIESNSGYGLKPIIDHSDGVNLRLNLEYTPKPGFFVISLAGIKGVGFKYRLEVSTTDVMIIPSGRPIISVIDSNHTQKLFEFYPHLVSSIYIKVFKCFGEVSWGYNTDPENTSEYQHADLTFDKFTQLTESRAAGKPVYLKAKKDFSAGRYSADFGYLDHEKNISVFSLEVFDQQGFNNIKFEEIKPYNEDLFVDLHTSPITVSFRPVITPQQDGVEYRVNYFVVVSKDPEALNFYAKCDSAYMPKVLKDGYNVTDAVMVFPTGFNPPLQHESTTLQPYMISHITLPSDHRYFMTVYAKVTMTQRQGAQSVQNSESLRIVYATVEFEYRSFFYPIELLASTLGLIGVIVATCFVLNTRLVHKLKKKIGFTQVGGEVDQDLEEYFMQIKHDYETMEGRRKGDEGSGSSGSRSRSSRGTPDESADQTINSSHILDQSIEEGNEPSETRTQRGFRSEDTVEATQIEPGTEGKTNPHQTGETELV